MLVLTRKPGESIQIGEEITISVVQVQGSRVRVGIAAPAEVSIRREELRPRLEREPAAADLRMTLPANHANGRE